MKKFLFSIIAVLLTAGIVQAQKNIPSAKPGVQYGKAIDNKGAISVKELPGKFNADSTYNGKIVGEVVEVCKMSGCFVKIKREGGGDPIMVRFRNYGFFLPQDIIGKTIVLEGQAKVKETSDINIIADGVIVVK